MEPKHYIINSDITPALRIVFQIFYLFLGVVFLLGFIFMGSFYFAWTFSVLLTCYVLVSFLFKKKKRQKIWVDEDKILLSSSISCSKLDKITLKSLSVIGLICCVWLFFDKHFSTLLFTSANICILFYFVYYTLKQKPTNAIDTNNQIAILDRGYGQCILVRRFDIYTFSEKKTFICTIEINSKDIDKCLDNLEKHINIIRGTIKEKLDWKYNFNYALFSFISIYIYIFKLPGWLKLLFPVGYHSNFKLNKPVYTSPFMSNLGVCWMMFVCAMPLIMFISWIISFFRSIKEQSRNVLILTNDTIFIIPSQKNCIGNTFYDHSTESFIIPTSEVQYLIWPKFGENKSRITPYLDKNVKLIDRNDKLIALSSWSWAANDIIHHLVKNGLPVRLE